MTNQDKLDEVLMKLSIARGHGGSLYNATFKKAQIIEFCRGLGIPHKWIQEVLLSQEVTGTGRGAEYNFSDLYDDGYSHYKYKGNLKNETEFLGWK